MSPEIEVGENDIIQVSFSHSEMLNLFGQSFMELMRNNDILNPTHHRMSGPTYRTFYTKQQVAKAVHALYFYHKLEDENYFYRAKHRIKGLIPNTDYKEMKKTQWWRDLNKKLKGDHELKKLRISLNSIISPFVIKTIR